MKLLTYISVIGLFLAISAHAAPGDDGSDDGDNGSYNSGGQYSNNSGDNQNYQQHNQGGSSQPCYTTDGYGHCPPNSGGQGGGGNQGQGGPSHPCYNADGYGHCPPNSGGQGGGGYQGQGSPSHPCYTTDGYGHCPPNSGGQGRGGYQGGNSGQHGSQGYNYQGGNYQGGGNGIIQMAENLREQAVQICQKAAQVTGDRRFSRMADKLENARFAVGSDRACNSGVGENGEIGASAYTETGSNTIHFCEAPRMDTIIHESVHLTQGGGESKFVECQADEYMIKAIFAATGRIERGGYDYTAKHQPYCTGNLDLEQSLRGNYARGRND